MAEEYPVTLNEFKQYFMREAGLEFQPYEEWVDEASYSKGDKVLFTKNFKIQIWESVVDENEGHVPGNDDSYWVEAEEDINDYILDIDITRAMGEASFKYNAKLFPEEKGKIIFLYLSMFFLVNDKQTANSGLNGDSAAGPVVSRTVGKMSVSYMPSTLFKSNPSYEFLASNGYGKKAYNLMAPYLRGGVRTFIGSNTGD